MRASVVRFPSRPAIASLLVISIAAIAVSSRAQVSTGEQDDLHDRLDAARAEISRIQEQAGSVEEQVASIDRQAGAVAKALEVSRALVERTQGRIALLEGELEETQRRFRQIQTQVKDMAVSLYKSGGNAQLEMLLSAESLHEMSSMLEYSSTAAENHIQLVVTGRRLEAQLNLKKADLKVALSDALEARAEQERQAQHLKELRAAKTAKLADLRGQIQATREEASAIQARSEEIAEQLAVAPAPTTSLAAGASGFAWPISGAITSGYGQRWGRMHQGIDIDCVTGAPIRASKAGTVVTASYDGGYGYHVVIDHGGGFASLYAHNSELQVNSGQRVSGGQVIAACGSTGQSTGDHLHFEIRVNGAPQDPLRYLP